MMLEDKPFDRELLELFGALIEEAEKPSNDPQFEELKRTLRASLKNFPERFASGAEELLVPMTYDSH